ncbi:CbtB domain-containing protein [Agrobacterium pusense]|uniref:Cobalt transporter, subunit B n=1 Tax=Agrobacterium pusense TaxID=648995 RepID=U4Q7R2_9HYPH|nr:CbtB domain-containing protein [Agrobacterium pusense]CDI12112.1 cobalt transporter, subunit B [Agrobacterium pusense]
MTTSSVLGSIALLSGTSSRILQSALAAFIGLVIVGFVGFSHLEVVHNAAHDTRHANAFPCH